MIRQTAIVVAVAVIACQTSNAPDAGNQTPSDGGTTPAPTAGSGHFTYSFEDKVFRIAAQAGATPENVSAKLAKFGAGTRDRWLIPSINGSWLVLSSDRLPCSMGECVVVSPRDLSTLELVKPGGDDISTEGTPAISNNGTTVVFTSQEGPHEMDVWVTREVASSWSSPTLLTQDSSYAYNNMPALTLDETRITFDCGAEPYPESGGNDACEVKLDGTGFRVLVTPSTLPMPREMSVQFPHDSVDGILFQGTWPIGSESPETIWLLPSTGAPTPIGKNFANAVSPCGLSDGRFGMLWLGRSGNASGAHELTLVSRDGNLEAVLTPGVDITDIGIGCGD